jgi:ABC-type lipoprotein export system ATPase subunit
VTPPALRLANVCLRYPGQAEAVVDVASLALGAGEQMLITGPSGCGKSTLLSLIAGLYDPAQGTIEVAGQDVHQLRGANRDLFRGRTIGMIFQTFNLLHGFSAVENVMAALKFSNVPRKEHRERAGALLTQLGIESHGSDPDRLSVGQQQRVAVARALACEPTLVLADEPTASLDPENAASAIELVRSACEASGAALLCVSHDPAVWEHFDRRAALADLVGDPAGDPARGVAGGVGG